MAPRWGADSDWGRNCGIYATPSPLNRRVKLKQLRSPKHDKQKKEASMDEYLKECISKCRISDDDTIEIPVNRERVLRTVRMWHLMIFMPLVMGGIMAYISTGRDDGWIFLISGITVAVVGIALLCWLAAVTKRYLKKGYGIIIDDRGITDRQCGLVLWEDINHIMRVEEKHEGSKGRTYLVWSLLVNVSNPEDYLNKYQKSSCKSQAKKRYKKHGTPLEIDICFLTCSIEEVHYIMQKALEKRKPDMPRVNSVNELHVVKAS